MHLVLVSVALYCTVYVHAQVCHDDSGEENQDAHSRISLSFPLGGFHAEHFSHFLLRGQVLKREDQQTEPLEDELTGI